MLTSLFLSQILFFEFLFFLLWLRIFCFLSTKTQVKDGSILHVYAQNSSIIIYYYYICYVWCAVNFMILLITVRVSIQQVFSISMPSYWFFIVITEIRQLPKNICSHNNIEFRVSFLNGLHHFYCQSIDTVKCIHAFVVFQ